MQPQVLWERYQEFNEKIYMEQDFDLRFMRQTCRKRNSEPQQSYININLDILPLGAKWPEWVQLRREHKH